MFINRILMLTTTLSTFETDMGKIPLLIISQPDIARCKSTLVISKCPNIVCFISLAVLLNITPIIHSKQTGNQCMDKSNTL